MNTFFFYFSYNSTDYYYNVQSFLNEKSKLSIWNHSCYHRPADKSNLSEFVVSDVNILYSRLLLQPY